MARTDAIAPPESLTDELDRLDRRARTDEAALTALRDDLHNAGVAVQQASTDQLHGALSRKRELERRLDELLEESAPIIERVQELRWLVGQERRRTQLARLHEAGNRFADGAPRCEETFAAAFISLRALTESAAAVAEAARGCGPDVLRDVTNGLQLASVKSWLLSQIDQAGLTVDPAVQPYDPRRLSPGATPTEASADLTVYLNTTR